MQTDKEIKTIEIATAYEIRLMLDEEFKRRNTETMTQVEVNDLIDGYARGRNKDS